MACQHSRKRPERERTFRCGGIAIIGAGGPLPWPADAVCCPARAAGRLPGGGQGVRGAAPLYTPLQPPYTPQRRASGGIVSAVPYPVRRASQGAAARTFPALRAGRCSRLLRRSVRPAGVRDRLRARAALHCPRHRVHPSLTDRQPSAGIAGTSGGRRGKKRLFLLYRGTVAEEEAAAFPWRWFFREKRAGEGKGVRGRGNPSRASRGVPPPPGMPDSACGYLAEAILS